MMVGLPLSIVMLLVAWFLLTKVLFKPEVERIPGGRQLFDDELRSLGPISSGEKRVLAVFVAAAVAGDLSLLPVLCIIILPTWLLVSAVPEFRIVPPSPAAAASAGTPPPAGKSAPAS